MTRRISVNVGGLWRTSVELKEEATWRDLETEIEKVTGVPTHLQKLEPNGENDDNCELEEGDDVFCDWKLDFGCHPLHYAAMNGNIKAIISWLASGADVNVKNVNGAMPLMYACLNLKEECMMELLRLGANVYVIDNDGNNILHYIAHSNIKNMERIAKMLIKAGCDPTKRNNENETFIDILKSRGNEKLAIELEEWMKETMK